MRSHILLELLVVLAPLSLAAVGGATGIYAPLQHEVVAARGWLTNREFLDLFAVARLVPGPGSLLGTLIGWRLAGFPGAVVATLALFLPSSLLCYGVSRIWDRHRGKSWHTALEAGLLPIGIGLIFAGIWSLLRVSEAGALSVAIVVAVALMLTWRPKLHPIPLLAAGAFAVLAATALG